MNDSSVWTAIPLFIAALVVYERGYREGLEAAERFYMSLMEHIEWPKAKKESSDGD